MALQVILGSVFSVNIHIDTLSLIKNRSLFLRQLLWIHFHNTVNSFLEIGISTPRVNFLLNFRMVISLRVRVGCRHMVKDDARLALLSQLEHLDWAEVVDFENVSQGFQKVD